MTLDSHAYRVHDDDDDDPVLLDSNGIPVDTWRENYPYDERMSRDEYEEQKRLLQKELSDAVEPRTFDPKGRYKSGEIIVHPEYGRGKVENVLRTSLLVRFLEGLRPLDLG